MAAAQPTADGSWCPTLPKEPPLDQLVLRLISLSRHVRKEWATQPLHALTIKKVRVPPCCASFLSAQGLGGIKADNHRVQCLPCHSLVRAHTQHCWAPHCHTNRLIRGGAARLSAQLQHNGNYIYLLSPSRTTTGLGGPPDLPGHRSGPRLKSCLRRNPKDSLNDSSAAIDRPADLDDNIRTEQAVLLIIIPGPGRPNCDTTATCSAGNNLWAWPRASPSHPMMARTREVY